MAFRGGGGIRHPPPPLIGASKEVEYFDESCRKQKKKTSSALENTAKNVNAHQHHTKYMCTTAVVGQFSYTSVLSLFL